jgi:hypothetical protein
MKYGTKRYFRSSHFLKRKYTMKKLYTLLAIVSIATTAVFAQDAKPSPAMNASAVVNGAEVNIDYSSPSVKGRTIFGGLVPYGKVWRTGANEATVITFDQDVTIDGKTVEEGIYSLFTIPGEEEWTVIINEEDNQWGAFKYDESKDMIRFKVTPSTNESMEKMTFSVGEDGLVSLMWATTKISFMVE